MALDYLAATLAALAAFGMVIGHVTGFNKLPMGILIAKGFAVAAFFPVALRRHSPLAAYVAQLAVALIAGFIGLGLTVALLVLASYGLYLVAVTHSRRTSLIALAVPLALNTALGLVTRAYGSRTPGATVPVALILIIAWIIGYSARQRRAYAVSLRDQAASSAVAEERLRIARELHDVVAHSMSVIAVQAGYGQYVMSSSPESASEALGAIQATSRDALEEMRRMLGVLRQQDAGGSGSVVAAGDSLAAELLDLSLTERAGSSPARASAPLAPAPGLRDLDRLVARTTGTGVRVDVRLEGTDSSLPAGIDLSAYRIVQEALTNVVKHAGTSATCCVVISRDDDAVSIDVTDDGGQPSGLPPYSVTGPPSPTSPASLTSAASLTSPASSTSAAPFTSLPPVASPASLTSRPPVATSAISGGHGLAGMRERVNLCGGEFSAGPWPGGGFRVRARLPLHPTLRAAS